jgi:hypothetical protein
MITWVYTYWREENQSINKENYFVQELYWGTFSRTISLPEEVDPEQAEAIEKHGLLIIKLPITEKISKFSKIKTILNNDSNIIMHGNINSNRHKMINMSFKMDLK